MPGDWYSIFLHIKRSVGTFFLLVPHSIALALLSSRNEQRRSPRRYVYKRLKLLRSQSWQSAILCRILHIHGRHCCFDHDYCFGTARFPSVRFKASSNAFPIYRSSSLSFHPYGHRHQSENRCKDSDYFSIMMAMERKTYNFRVVFGSLKEKS